MSRFIFGGLLILLGIAAFGFINVWGLISGGIDIYHIVTGTADASLVWAITKIALREVIGIAVGGVLMLIGVGVLKK